LASLIAADNKKHNLVPLFTALMIFRLAGNEDVARACFSCLLVVIQAIHASSDDDAMNDAINLKFIHNLLINISPSPSPPRSRRLTKTPK